MLHHTLQQKYWLKGIFSFTVCFYTIHEHKTVSDCKNMLDTHFSFDCLPSFIKLSTLSSSFFDTFNIKRKAKNAAIVKMTIVIAAGIYSVLSSGKYKNNPIIGFR